MSALLGRSPSDGSERIPEPVTTPPVTGATASVGSTAVVVTWNLAKPLDHDTTPTLLTVWLPRNGAGPVQLGLIVDPPATLAFAVDFETRTIERARPAQARVGARRIVALFPLEWVDDLDPIEVSHTSVSIDDDDLGDTGLRLDFTT
jgi:hypothetical protein